MPAEITTTTTTDVSHPTALDKAMTAEFSELRAMGRVIPTLTTPNSCTNPPHDFFSNDYLSLSISPVLRSGVLSKLSAAPYGQLLGATGSRLAGGSTPLITQLEERFKIYYEADAALLFNSGFEANASFFGRIPQAEDAIIYDAAIHASTREGMRGSRPAIKRALYMFQHNDMEDFRRVLVHVLKKHPKIALGQATAFVAVESLYSMDGGFVPLKELVSMLEALVPPTARHLIVDEAHTTGVYGRGGRGLVDHFGLQSHVQTRLHTFGKAPAVAGAVLICSPTVRKYIINGARQFIFTTALPGFSVLAIEASFDIIDSPLGSELVEKLFATVRLFHTHLVRTLAHIPQHILRLERHFKVSDTLVSPIFPLMTDYAVSLETYLQQRGYMCQAVQWPVVPKGEDRVRVSVHAENSEEEMLALLRLFITWAGDIMREEAQGEMTLERSSGTKKTSPQLAKL